MGSSSSKATNTDTNNLAVDRSATLQEGTQILDSIIVDNADKVLIKTIEQHRAAFEVLASNSSIQLGEMGALAEKVLDLADTQQVTMQKAGYDQLKAAVEFIKSAQKQGKYIMEFAELATAKSFDLSTEVVGNQNDRLDQALDLVADVKTSSYSETLKMLSLVFLTFGLGAIYLTRDK